MTEILWYSNLTWPDIAALPRNIPLIIPLGELITFDPIANTLGNPSCVGVLPAIPFGWEGSGLTLPESIFVPYLSNLLESLRDDGFSQVFALTPPGIAMSLSASRIVIPSSYGSQNRTSNPIPPDAERQKVVLIPIGHTEQHGHHLPVATDTMIIDALSQRIAAGLPSLACNLPAMPYGVSTHRASFAGTLNAGGRAFEDFWIGVIDVLAQRGFDRFYFMSGHGGNCSFLVNVVKYAGELHRRIFCATSWLYLSGPGGVETITRYRRSSIGGMGHAGELETSLIMYLRPELVRSDRIIDETDFISTPSYFMDWVEGGALIANPPWDDDTVTGPYGAGSLATAENGKTWLDAAVSEKLDHVREIHEQHNRREARRQSGFGLWGKNYPSK
jgi:creatinine amidohydrolase